MAAAIEAMLPAFDGQQMSRTPGQLEWRRGRAHGDSSSLEIPAVAVTDPPLRDAMKHGRRRSVTVLDD